jgi:hypothetical protein
MISEIKGHEFKEGEKSRFLLELFAPDLEQLEEFDIKSKMERLKRSLNQFSPKEVSKFYYLDKKIYFDTPCSKKRPSYFESEAFSRGLVPFTLQKNICSNPLFKDDFCKLNAQYFRFVSISLREDHFLDVGGLQEFGDYFFFFKKVKTQFSKSLADNARKMNHSSLYQALSDIEGIEAYKENEVMLRKIIERTEELFHVEIFFVVRSVTEEDLFNQTNVLLEELEIKGLTPKIETISLNHILKCFMPGVEPTIDNPLLVHSSLLTNFMPTHQDKLVQKGIPFYSRSASELYLDLKTGDSFSSVITGATGNGKTMLAQKILDYELSQGRKCLILDPKRDYHKFALLKNAYFIDDSINPMIFKDPIYLRNMILSKVPKNERNALWEGRLLRVIRDTEAFKEDHFFRAIEKIQKNGFSDLEYYFEDIRDKISTESCDLRDFTYIELDSFCSQSLPFILSFVFEYVKRLNAPYNLVIDEAHRIFKHDPVFLEERVREMRVQNSSLVTLTQSYGDLVSNRFGEVVADNSFHKIFFKQTLEPGQGISAFDCSHIGTLYTVQREYSEFYYKTEQFRKILRYYPTYKELELYKSGNEENKKMLSYIKEKLPYFSVDECVNQWVRDKYAL